MKDEKNVPNDAMNELKNALNGVQTVVFDLDGTLYDKSGLTGACHLLGAGYPFVF